MDLLLSEISKRSGSDVSSFIISKIGDDLLVKINRSCFVDNFKIDKSELNVDDLKSLSCVFINGSTFKKTRSTSNSITLFNKKYYKNVSLHGNSSLLLSKSSVKSGLIVLSGVSIDPIYSTLLDLFNKVSFIRGFPLFISECEHGFLVKDSGVTLTLESIDDVLSHVVSSGINDVFINSYYNDKLFNLSITLAKGGFHVVSVKRDNSSLNTFCNLYNKDNYFTVNNLIGVVGVSEVPLIEGSVKISKFKDVELFESWGKISSSPNYQDDVLLYGKNNFDSFIIRETAILIDIIFPDKKVIDGFGDRANIESLYGNMSKNSIPTNYDHAARLLRDKKTSIDLINRFVGCL